MKESPSSDPLHRVKSWYGLPAEIAVENGLWHLVRVGGIALGHPPLVNLVLRRGLPTEDRLHLSFLHEYGHLQTLPLALLHALLLLLFGRWPRLGWEGRLKRLAAATIAHEAVWELASETYVLAKTGRRYRQIYRKHPNLPRTLALITSLRSFVDSNSILLGFIAASGTGLATGLGALPVLATRNVYGCSSSPSPFTIFRKGWRWA